MINVIFKDKTSQVEVVREGRRRRKKGLENYDPALQFQ